ncbi:maleylpyruvate isomerase family mycothiol-dependent enzyme [Georgenia sp. Z1344]|uniref:maleylpyruvate isomerase family mycothiol-dependent enzyme n=1 Tax=Georgenia sp. Z1344 TaxID=3416706 RepID=UPI003CF55AAC
MTDTYDLLVTERTRLTELLAGLSPEQWRAQSLCENWSVREVVAHMTAHLIHPDEEYGSAEITSIADMNAMLDDWARSDAAARTDAELLELYRSGIESRWAPEGGGLEGALSHDVIHGLDITVPLGLPGPATDAVERAISGGGPENWGFFGVDLAGYRLVATDADVSVGDGERLVERPVTEVLRILTARRPFPARNGAA